MIRYEFAPDDFLRTRFAISPLYELTQSVAALRDPASASLHLPWIRSARERVVDIDLAPLEALVPPQGYQPDFVSPPPQTPLPDVEEEIERVRRTRPAQIRREFTEAFGEGPAPNALRPLLERPRSALKELADLLAAYWERALAPDWEPIRQVLEDDIAYRARLLTTGGPIEVFADLHPEVRWHEDRLEFVREYHQTIELAGRGLVLIPSAFVWPRAAALWDPPWQPALIYPARGVANLYAPARRDPTALGALLGARRAEILIELEREATTTAIARRLGASPAGVSEHLAVLRRSGLIHARRQRREVLYKRTPAGEALLRAGQ